MSQSAIRAMGKALQLACVVLTLAGCASVDPYAAPPMAQRATGAAQEQAWRMRLQQLDEAARATELANAALSVEDLPRCRSLLDAADAAAIKELRASAKVPDDYSLGTRALGVYPLARLPFAAGIARWQAGTRSAFKTPLEALPMRGQLQRYIPPPGVSKPVPPPSLDPLGVPVFAAAEAAALFARHAPVLEIDVAGGFDRIGALTLDRDDRVIVAAAITCSFRPKRWWRVICL